ncbi:MAG: hypothetical protein FJZ97_07200 [Chloroflexi bacterium]|nr:hypothetical protein [Chloroflexota bacterium]
MQAILDYLNGGGSVDTLAAILKTSGRAPNTGPPVLSLDINGDPWLDLAVAYVDPLAPQASAHGHLRLALQPPSRGIVALYLCQGTRYISGEPVLEAPDAAPNLHLAGDLTGDGVSDLVVGWETCGAHTCYQELDAVMAEGSTLARVPLDPTLDLPYPEVRLLPDGRLAVTGTGIASAGAGPFRQITRAWSWEAGHRAFAVDTEILEPPRFRIHVLLDGEAAARGGDWDLALDLYHRVVVDDALLDWADPPSERANLTGYSMYRTVVAYASKGDQGDAKVAYGILQNQYLGGSMGRAYAELATAFWDAYTPAGDLELGCQAARAFAEAHRTEVLDPLFFGYANPTFTPGDVCPASGT